jgi:hypothetical protein
MLRNERVFPALSFLTKSGELRAMAKHAGRWALEDLIDFESEIAAATRTPPDVRSQITPAVKDLGATKARRVGFRIWLDGVRSSSHGRKFTAALTMVGSAFAVVMFVAGISGVWGLVDWQKGGLHVTLFLALLIGGQWLVLLLAAVAWLLRRRAVDGFSTVQALVGKLARRLAGERDAPWWNLLMDADPATRGAVLWRLGRMAQAAGIFFNLGILSGLAGLVLVKHVGFFWETTTVDTMHLLLEQTARFLSVPWSGWWPEAVPDAGVIHRSRWMPDHPLPPGPPEWWRFLLMATLVWGFAPRLLLWLTSWFQERRALGGMEFQARAHRALWRDLTGSGRVDADDKPLDGVLVLDVGGSGLTVDGLRPFLLRRMRVHPAVWHSVAVLDPGAEAEAAGALAKAPAGVVLLAEGWALSPPRMDALHAKVRSEAGRGIPIKFLIANTGPGKSPVPPSPDECREWERYVDSLRDPDSEVFFFEALQPCA